MPQSPKPLSVQAYMNFKLYFARHLAKPQSVQAFMDHIYVQSYRAMEAMCRKDVRLNSQSYMLFRIKKDFLRVVNILASQYLKVCLCTPHCDHCEYHSVNISLEYYWICVYICVYLGVLEYIINLKSKYVL